MGATMCAKTKYIKNNVCTDCPKDSTCDGKTAKDNPVGCKFPKFKGDGNCDDDNNNKGCAYDGGDCCPKTVKGGTVNKEYCNHCKCVDPDNQVCGAPEYKGDGNCDDENNHKGCAYDGGDCCPKTVKGGTVKKQYCKQCNCVDPDNQK